MAFLTAPPRSAAASPPAEATCCVCFLAMTVLRLASVALFLLGFALCGIGIYVNQRFEGWDLSAVNLLGWFCFGVGIVCVCLSLIGICAARTQSASRLPIFGYFLTLLMILAFVMLACVIAAVESDKVRAYVHQHWDTIHARLGLSAFAEDRDGDGQKDELTIHEAVELLREWLVVIASVVGGAIAILLVALGSAMKVLGLRAIAMCFLASNGLIGLAEIAISAYTYNHIPLATSALLLGCAGIQLICSVTGIVGFKRLNRECICCSMLVLLCAVCGLAYSSVASYLWVRNVKLLHPEHLLLVFAICLVADFFLLGTLVFVSLLYCYRRHAFTEVERAQQLGVEYSDYDQRVRERRAASKERMKRGGAGGHGGVAGRGRMVKTSSCAEYATADHL